MAQQHGLVTVLNNSDIQARDDARAQENASVAADPADDPLIGRIGVYLDLCWQAALDAKVLPQQEMLEDLRQRNGEYSPQKLQEIAAIGGSQVKMMLTGLKCRAAEGWLHDILFPSGDRPFSVHITPEPDLSPDVKQNLMQLVLQETEQALASGIYPSPQQVYQRSRQLYDEQKTQIKVEAETRADRMEDAIDDALVEGQWYSAMEEFISHMVGMPFGIIKGPVIRKKRTLAWKQDAQGKWAPMPTDELTPMFYAPNPLDIYPAPDSKDVDDGYLFERIPTRRSALYNMIGVPGYSETAIRKALDDYTKGYSIAVSDDSQRQIIEDMRNKELSPDKTLDVLEFHGSIRGEMLIEWGMDKSKVPDEDQEYNVTAWKLGRYVIRCVMNEDPLGRRPYVKASFDPIIGSFYGRGIPRIIQDLQNMCDACARAISNNMGMASGPMMEIEVDRLAEGQDITAIHPFKIIQTKSATTGTPSPAVRWNQPSMNVEPLLKVYEFFSGLADAYSGIQSYEQGLNPRAGAAGTASGLSMLMSAASRQIKRVISYIDNVTKGCVERLHTHLMLYSDDDDIKGDAQLEARGAESLIAKEQMQVRRTEFLQATNNPVDMSIIGPEGRAQLLREAVKDFEIDPDSIVPDKDTVLAKAKAAMTAAIPQNPQAPAGMQGPPPGMPGGMPPTPIGPPPGTPPIQGGATLLPGGMPAGGQEQNLFQRSAMN